MKLVSSLHEIHDARRAFSGVLGLVPTMGYLHQGHLSLVERASRECDHVVVSIFVNPAQFGPNEDLARYPRDLDRDLALLKPLEPDVVWTPASEEMYPEGYQTWVEVEDLTRPLEGGLRPGHFRGVTTIVARLFNAVRPDKAYFGQKDAQQAAVLRRMTRDLSYPIEVVVCPTVREPDGLAMSSRNKYLEGTDRQAALVLSSALSSAGGAFHAGERNAESLRRIMLERLGAEPRARVQYVSCADYETLEELEIIRRKALLSLAVFIGNTRLIDNLVLEP